MLPKVGGNATAVTPAQHMTAALLVSLARALLGAHAPLRSVLPPNSRLDEHNNSSNYGEWVAADVDFRGPGWIDNYTSVIKKTGVGGPNGFWGAPQYLCSGRLQGKDLPRVRKLVAWRWKTGDGELVPPIKPPVLASIAARHPIALLGDSLNHELFTSLVGLLASQKPRVQSGKAPHLIFPSDANRNATVSDFEMEVALENGGRLSQLDYALMKINETAGKNNLTAPFGPTEGAGMQEMLAHAANSGFRVLVMSSLMMRSTTHCVREGTNVSQATLASDKAMAAAVGGHFRSAAPTFDLLVYIIFDPSHPVCHTYTRPTSERPDVNAMPWDWLKQYRQWCWGQVKQRSEHLAHALHAHVPRERFALIDARRLTGTRPEAHSIRLMSGAMRPLERPGSDCMHFCLPGGPIETWADLLQALLQQRLG